MPDDAPKRTLVGKISTKLGRLDVLEQGQLPLPKSVHASGEGLGRKDAHHI